MVRERIVVTGVGPLSAIGSGREPFWSALLAGRPGFGPITLCDASKSPSKIAAEIPEFQLGEYVERGRVLARRTPRSAQFAIAAAIMTLHDAGFDVDAADPDRFGISVGTSVGSIREIFNAYENGKAAPLPAHTAFFMFTHYAACAVSSMLNIRGPMHTISQGCNSGLDALGQAMRLIQSGGADAMLVIGTDCEVTPEVLAVLNASGSLTTRWNDQPARGSRPFDRARDGNVIGEGAAGLLLESESHARARGARAYAELAGQQVVANGHSRRYSHDQPELDTRSSVRSMLATLRDASIAPTDVDVVSANGSSSVNYDLLEALALAEVFGGDLPRPLVHSTKSMLGQHGAGSTALQAAAACLSAWTGDVPPTINIDDPDPACGPLRLSGRAEHASPRHILAHAIGFGGFYSSAAVFRRVNDDSLTRAEPAPVRWSERGDEKFAPAARFCGGD